MKLTSSAFSHASEIPSIHTCDGKDLPPPLAIHDAPPRTQSFVLICDDPDVPKTVRADQMYDHWVLFNIPPTTRTISDKIGVHGKNTNNQNCYIGPCPPDREHRYFFKLYALDQMLSLQEGATKKEVERAMQGHILAECTLMGLYERKGKH